MRMDDYLASVGNSKWHTKENKMLLLMPKNGLV